MLSPYGLKNSLPPCGCGKQGCKTRYFNLAQALKQAMARFLSGDSVMAWLFGLLFQQSVLAGFCTVHHRGFIGIAIGLRYNAALSAIPRKSHGHCFYSAFLNNSTA
jgi:hypothetical protein